MNTALSILQYLGIVTTGAMAVLSLFFKFTKDDAPRSKSIISRLTKPGQWALATICLSVVASLASTIIGESSEALQRRAAAAENDRLARELRLTTESFDTVALRLTFESPVDWRDPAFLAIERREQLSGGWTDGNASLAAWLMTKDAEAPARYAYDWEMQYVETRENILGEFLRQNPEFARGPPVDALEFIVPPGSTAPYAPPAALYFGAESYDAHVSRLSFSAGSPQLRVRYDNETGVVVTLHTQISYSDLIGSTLSLNYSFHSNWSATGAASIDGQPFEYTPTDIPPILQLLRSVDVLFNDQVVARAFDSARNQIKPTFNSQQDFHDSIFTARLLSDFAITRAMLIEHYEPRG